MKARKAPRHYTHAGFSIPALRRAVKAREVETIPFGGLDRMPPREIDRLREIFRTDATAQK